MAVDLKAPASPALRVPEAASSGPPPAPVSTRAAVISRLLRSHAHGRIFLAVFAVKCLAVLLYTPELYEAWWLPFLKSAASGTGGSDPWSGFLDAGGAVKSFPYGPGMVAVLGVLLAVARGLEPLTVGFPVLLADTGILLLLIYGFHLKSRKAVYIYWCSPVVFYINYVHGQLDVIPMFLLFASLFLITSRRHGAAFLVLALGVATKDNLLLAAPFLVLFSFQRLGARRALTAVAPAVFVYVALVGPLLAWSHGYQRMVLGAEERAWLYVVSVPVGDHHLVLTPLVLGVLCLNFALYRKANADLLMMYVGLAFAAVLLLVPGGAPGWYTWLVPFFCYYSLRSLEFHPLPLAVFSGLFLLYFAVELPHESRVLNPAGRSAAATLLALEGLPPRVMDLLFTALRGATGFIAVMMYGYGVRSNAFYRRRRTARTIGVGGDSASGKDTFCALVRGVLGHRNVIQVDGDDAHKWERGHQMWRVVTHLDPRANDLYLQMEHARTLREGKAVVRRAYRHEDGRFSEARIVESNAYVLVSGLHPFYLKGMRELLDLKVFLSPDEGLRARWKLARDTTERRHAPERVIESLRERRADSERYIRPQMDFADLVIGYMDGESGGLRAAFETENSANLSALVEELSKVPTLEVSHVYEGPDKQTLAVEGSVPAQLVREMASAAIPNLDEIIDPRAKFEPDVKGIVQLVFLTLLSAKERADAA